MFKKGTDDVTLANLDGLNGLIGAPETGPD
jgi:hypothetical protein